MRFHVTRSTKVALLSVGALVASCAGPKGDPGQPRPDFNVLTQKTLVENHFQTAYDAVQALRSNWLNAKGPDSFTTPTEVRVYLNGTMLGGVETLREIGTPTLVSIRHYDGIAATARWGLGHGAGVIYVSTREDSGEPADRVGGKPPLN
jgi:hypothetical protein